MFSSKKVYRYFVSFMTAVITVMVVTPAAGLARDFPDVKNHWAEQPINYLVQKEAIKGYPNGTFQPDGPITRAETVTILAATLGIEVDETVKTTFPDAEDHWSSAAIAALQSQTEVVISGYEDGTFRPDDPITRQELAKMIVTVYTLEANEDVQVEFIDNNGWGAEYVNILASHGVVAGKSVGVFAPEDDVTRAETATFIHRTEVPYMPLPPTFSM